MVNLITRMVSMGIVWRQCGYCGVIFFMEIVW